MDGETGVYRIGAVAHLTGLSAHTLRAWERRYANLHPVRTDTGLRLYSESQVERLRLIQRLIGEGYAIGTLAALDTAELAQLAPSEPRAVPPIPIAADGVEGALAATFALKFLGAMARHDTDAAERLLAQAVLAFSVRDLVALLLVPLLQEVGARWADGRLTISDEHAISAMVRSQLGIVLRGFRPAAEAPVVLATTPAAELHELGALLAALLAAEQGWQVRYLGPNLPADAIAEAAMREQAHAVLLSIPALPVEAALAEIGRIRQLLPQSTRLLVGGAVLARVALPPRTTWIARLEHVPGALGWPNPARSWQAETP